MVVIDATTVNEIYTRHRDWYPSASNPKSAPERIDGLADILDQFDLILLDSYGVLCRGKTPIEGARDAIALMRQKGKSFCVVSNDTMTNHSVAEEKYHKRGFDFSADEIITSLDVTEKFIVSIETSENWGVIAPENHPSRPLLAPMVSLNQHHGVIPETITHLLFLTASGWTEEMQENLVHSAGQRQFELVVGNPDVGAPNDDTIVATPGYFLADFVQKTKQVNKPVLYGKPDNSIFNSALKRFNFKNPERILMVGDTLYTDILGGNAMGFKTLLLECGIYKGQDLPSEIHRAGITPHYIAANL